MQIEVRRFETTPNYYVRIGDDAYEMSRDADMPNGVCIYLGPCKDMDTPDFYMPMKKIPIGIVRQIANICARSDVLR